MSTFVLKPFDGLGAKCPCVHFLNQLISLFRLTSQMQRHAIDRIEMLKSKLFELVSLQLVACPSLLVWKTIEMRELFPNESNDSPERAVSYY